MKKLASFENKYKTNPLYEIQTGTPLSSLESRGKVFLSFILFDTQNQIIENYFSQKKFFKIQIVVQQKDQIFKMIYFSAY